MRRTARVMQLEGLFDVPPTRRSEVAWKVNLPLDERPWNIGLFVGPSGCGKTTIVRELFGGQKEPGSVSPAEGTAAGSVLVEGFEWPGDRALVDAFPSEMSIKEITGLLCSVGFSSPPSWLRPFRVLSLGEQFRATMARALAEGAKTNKLIVIDEFTSVVDRTVAQIGSAAVAKVIRRRSQQFIASSCHYDIIDWLCPDWIYEPATGEFQWRCLRQRPQIELEIVRVHREAWQLFKSHHYLSTSLSSASQCFLAFFQNRPAAFTAVLHMPHPTKSGWREHRTVCLPDFQGVGIGNALSEFVAGVYRATGKRYYSVTSSPAMIHHRARSGLWQMHRKPSRACSRNSRSMAALNRTSSSNRFTAGFHYVGPVRPAEAQALGIVGRVERPLRAGLCE